MNPKSLIVLCSALAMVTTSFADPVTGWSIGQNNAGIVSLTNEGTSSPTLGDGSADDADNTAIYAAFPAVTLALGDKLTFSGSMQLSTAAGATPTALAAEFRFGVFNVNSSANVNGWLGYYAASASGATGSGLRRRNSPNTASYISATGTSLLYTNTLVDTSKTFQDETYDFSLSLERTASGMKLDVMLQNDQGYAFAPMNFVDTAPNTFTFDRVGFLSGGGLNADQLQFSNLDISVTPVPEPSTIACLAIGSLFFLRFRRKP